MAQGEIPRDFEDQEGGGVIVSPERFKNAGEIADCCNEMVDADRQRAPWRASIDGLIDGNATFKLSTLKAKGQAWRARCNYRGAEGALQSVQTPFYDLVTEVDPCVEVMLDFGKGVDQADWANAIASDFHWMLMKKWRESFNFHIQLQQLEMLKHGLGCHIWPGKKSCWCPDTPATGMVLFPDGVTINLKEKLDYFMLRDFLPGFALYKHIRNEEAATKLGWNVDTVWQALAQSSKNQYRTTGGTGRYTAEQAQREYKAGDIGTSNSHQSGIWLNHLFVKEIETGMISQYTVAEGIVVNGPTGGKTDDPWASCLFRKRNKFDEWPLVIFPYGIGNAGLIHTIRGLGARTKDFFELMNRLTNAEVDQVLVGSLMTVKQTGAQDPDKLRLTRIGMMNIIPQGLEIVPGVQFPPLDKGPIALIQQLERGYQTNNQSYLQGTPEPVDRETATSFSSRTQNSGQVSKGIHSLYAGNWQQALERMLVTAASPQAAVGDSYDAELARAFQERCIRHGVPKEALVHIEEVNEVLSTGAGSPAARIDALSTIFERIYPTTTEPRKINIERDLVATLVSSSKVDRYARSHDDNNLPDEDSSLAVVENNGLASGGDALVSPQQNHVEHLTEHGKKAQEIVQAVMAGQMDPEQALAIIQKFGAHMADHLKALSGNPMRKAEFEQLRKEWVALSVIADKLQQQISQHQNSNKQPPKEQISDSLKIGQAKVAASERIGMAKVASKGRIDLSKLAIDSKIKAAELAMNGSRKVAA
jgi:hypothetical protein